MARKLDRKRPYGETFHSEASDGRKYEQDGVAFDAAGDEWVPPVVEAPAATPDPNSDAFKQAVADAVAEALKAAGVKPK